MSLLLLSCLYSGAHTGGHTYRKVVGAVKGKRRNKETRESQGQRPAENKSGRRLSPLLSLSLSLCPPPSFFPSHCISPRPLSFSPFSGCFNALVGPHAIAARSLSLSRALVCSPSLALYAPSCLIFSFCLEGAGGPKAALPSACIPPDLLLLCPPLPFVRPSPDPPLGQTRAWSQQWTDMKRGKFKKGGGAHKTCKRPDTHGAQTRPAPALPTLDNTS